MAKSKAKRAAPKRAKATAKIAAQPKLAAPVSKKTEIAAPKQQKGYVNPFAGWLNGYGLPLDAYEDNPELLWPNSVRTYTKMRRGDARVSSVFRAVGLPVRRTPWRIDQNGATDEVTEFVANELGLQIVSEDAKDAEARAKGRVKGRFSWSKHLQLALLHLQYGHSVFERTFDVDENNRAHLVVQPRPAGTIAFWNTGADGEVISIQQWPSGAFGGLGMMSTGAMAPAMMGNRPIPASQLIIYQHEPDPGVPYGNSLLRPAYKHWCLKDRAMRIQIAALGRYGIGVPGFTASEDESEDQDRLDEYADMAMDYTGGENAGFSIPAGATFKIYGPEGQPMDPQSAIDYHDRQIGIVALANFLNLDGRGGGSYALANVLSTTFTDSVQTVAVDVRDEAQADLVEPLVTANWGENEACPMLVFDEIGSRQDAAAASLALLAANGLITPDPLLEAAIRQASGLPAPDPDAENPDTEHADPAEPAVQAYLRTVLNNRRKGAITKW